MNKQLAGYSKYLAKDVSETLTNLAEFKTTIKLAVFQFNLRRLTLSKDIIKTIIH